MIGIRHSVVCGRISLVKVSVEWVTWLTVFEQRVSEEEELISHKLPSLCIRRLAVLDRKLQLHRTKHRNGSLPKSDLGSAKKKLA